jgi:hypothetical protein
VAAYVSLGVKPNAFGYETKSLKELGFPKPIVKEGRLFGKILHVDAFGNVMSNIDEEKLFRFTQSRPFAIRAGRKVISGLKKGYSDGKKGQPIGLLGSSGFLEISVREGNAQKLLKLKKGDPMVVSMKLQAPNTK